MAQDHYLAEAIADSVLSKLILVTASKAENAGKAVEMADAKYTSQRRSDRGTIVPKDLLGRIHDCPLCGLKPDRGPNAVRSILAFVLMDREEKLAGKDLSLQIMRQELLIDEIYWALSPGIKRSL